jgi:hypothetical protein
MDLTIIDSYIAVSAILIAIAPVKLMLFRPAFALTHLPYLNQPAKTFEQRLVENYGRDVFRFSWTRAVRTILLFLTLAFWIETSSETYTDAWYRILFFACMHIGVSWLFLTTRDTIKRKKAEQPSLSTSNMENDKLNWVLIAMFLAFLPSSTIFFLGDLFEKHEMRYLEELRVT